MSEQKTYLELEAENAKLRSLLEKACKHIEAFGDHVSPTLIREAIK